LLLKAAVRNPSIKGSWTSALGHKPTFNQRPSNCSTEQLIYKIRAPKGAHIH
jgi:hypothetical protein